MPKLPMLMVEPIQPQASDCGGKQTKQDKVLIDFVSPNRPQRELRTCQSLKENPIMTKTDLDDWKASVACIAARGVPFAPNLLHGLLCRPMEAAWHQ